MVGQKKTGFGSGYFNGFGGKVEVGETVKQGACRELLEEAKVTVEQRDLHHRGVILFDFYDPPLVPMQVRSAWLIVSDSNTMRQCLRTVHFMDA